MSKDELARKLELMANGLRGSMWANRNEIIDLLDRASEALRPTPPDDLVEAVAEALWQAESERAASRRRLIAWTEAGPGVQETWRFMARAALSATQQPLEADVVDIAGVEGMLDGLSNLALDAFFELNAFDEEEGGYQKLATIAAALGAPVSEVEAALEELVKLDLGDFSEDLLAIDRETDEEYPWGAGYARSEEGARLHAIYMTLQYHENAFSLRHRLSSQGGVSNG